jgi:hypothetical protein
MVSVSEKATSPSQDDAWAAIAAALNQDASNLVTIDDHDPLGVAFYVHAITQCKFASHETNDLALAARSWVDDKLEGTPLSTYKDRDIAAIGLFLYTFHPHGAQKETDSRFAGIVEPLIDSCGGIFSNFFTSVLVGLALRSTNPEHVTTKHVVDFVNNELTRNWASIVNDPKNLVIAYWWARETQQQAVVDRLIVNAKQIAAEIQPAMDSIVYASYVLLEEAERMTRKERSMIRDAVEAALRAISSYTTEALAPSLADFYGKDASTFPDILEAYGHEMKPRFSRILIAIGLMIQFSYSRKLASLLSARARALQSYRGAVSLIICLVLVVLFYWLGSRISLPADTSPFLKSGTFLGIAQGLIFLLANVAFWSVVLLPLSFAFHFLTGLMIRGQFRDEVETMAHAWASFKDHYRGLILFPVIVTLLTAIIHL